MGKLKFQSHWLRTFELGLGDIETVVACPGELVEGTGGYGFNETKVQ